MAKCYRHFKKVGERSGGITAEGTDHAPAEQRLTMGVKSAEGGHNLCGL